MRQVGTSPADYIGKFPVGPLRPSEHVVGPRLLGAEKPIGRLAVDGDSVAYAVGSTETELRNTFGRQPSL